MAICRMSRRLGVFFALILVVTIFTRSDALALPAPPEGGTAYIVTTLEDVVAADGLVSLREAIEAANTNQAVNEAPAGSDTITDTITFDLALDRVESILLHDELVISDDLYILMNLQPYFYPDSYIWTTENGMEFRYSAFIINGADTNVTLAGLKMSDFSGQVQGALIYNEGTLNMYNCWISGNGGTPSTIYSSGSLGLYGCTLYNNRSGYGLIHSEDGDIHVFDCNFEDNFGWSDGSAIWLNNSNAYVSECIFDYNCAESYESRGGVIFSQDSDFTLDGCVINNCESGLRGGAIFTLGGSLTILDSVMANCRSPYGGAIYSGYTDIGIQNSSFIHNQAYEYGCIFACGVFLGHSTFKISNSEMYANESFDIGGAIYLHNGIYMTMTNCTIADNTRRPVYLIESDGSVINNSIICHNGNGDSENSFYHMQDIAYNSLIDAYPLFRSHADPGSDGMWNTSDDETDYRFMRDSVAINGGDSSLAVDIFGDPLTTDIEGNPRIVGSSVDIGAYEQSEVLIDYPDFDDDGDVDIFDFLILRDNYSTKSGATFAQGDTDGDGDVDIFDFLRLKRYYGAMY